MIKVKVYGELRRRLENFFPPNVGSRINNSGYLEVIKRNYQDQEISSEANKEESVRTSRR